ncbi:hypothetical protein HDU86_005691 [Geranomyces michiganensis]|nr:hypothetical protein HDU86_005691 [Geranomyces michiganensis]
METVTIADPFPFDNPQANPAIILRNAIALENSAAAIRALRLCAADPAKLAGVTSAEAEAVLGMVLKRTGKADVEEITDIANLVNGLVATPEGSASLITLWGRAGDLAAAVRTAKSAAAASSAPESLRSVHEALVSLFAEAGHSAEAAELLKRSPTAAGYAAVIRSYANSQSMDAAVEVYQEMLAARVTPTAAIIEALIDGYAAGGRITSAFKYFNELKARGLPQSSAAWTGMIRVHAVKGNVGDAVSYYRQMREAGVEATAETYTHLIAVHGKHKDIAGASRFFYKKELVKGFEFSPQMYAALMEAYATAGQLDLAWRTFAQAVKASPEIEIPAVPALVADVAGKHPSYLRDMIRGSGIPVERAERWVTDSSVATAHAAGASKSESTAELYQAALSVFMGAASTN